VIIENGQYVLRQIGVEEVEWVRKMHNDPDILKMLADPVPVTPARQKAWYASLLKSKKSQRLIVVHDEKLVGLVRIDDLDLNNKSVCIGLDIHKKYRGKGHAVKIYNLLLDYFFEKAGMHRCWLFVADYNTIARYLYAKLGFQYEGRAREALYRFGKFHDYHMMSILKNEYKPNKPALKTKKTL